MKILKFGEHTMACENLKLIEKQKKEKLSLHFLFLFLDLNVY